MTSRAAFPAAESHLVTVGGVRGATVMTGAPLRSAAHWVLPEELHAGVPKKILVTGGNAGIGFALCTQLAAKGCHVYLCARSVERGEAAVAAIREETPDAKVELVQCDTADDASVAAAAAAVKASLRGETLYAIVNNAGVNRGDPADIINVNVHGPKRVCEAFAPLWQSAGGRVVNVGSGGGPSFVAKHPQHRELLCFYYTTWEQLEALLETEPWSDGASLRANAGPPDIPAAEWTAYCCSKASVHVYTRVLARQCPNALCSTVSPGFIATGMTEGYGASKPPEEGTADLPASGLFFGSDGVRSPLHTARDPGTPAYEGDADYDLAWVDPMASPTKTPTKMSSDGRAT